MAKGKKGTTAPLIAPLKSAYTPKQPTLAVTIEREQGPVYVLGGSYYALEDSWLNPDVIIRAVDPWEQSKIGEGTMGKFRLNTRARNWLSPELKEPIIMEILWPDGEAPKLRADFWTKLHAKIATLPAYSEVYCCCTGGSGRTGTILSILHGLEYPECTNPIQTIRDNYYPTAVESMEQVDYVRAVTGTDMPSVKGSLFTTFSLWEDKGVPNYGDGYDEWRR